MDHTPDWSRISTSTGYKVVHCPDHPAAWSTGYVYVHRIVAEAKLGRLLKKGEVVHHKDANKQNNDPCNIEVTNSSKHASMHAKPTTMVALVCAECGKEFERRKGKDPKGMGYKRAFCSRKCSGHFIRRSQINRGMKNLRSRGRTD